MLKTVKILCMVLSFVVTIALSSCHRHDGPYNKMKASGRVPSAEIAKGYEKASTKNGKIFKRLIKKNRRLNQP